RADPEPPELALVGGLGSPLPDQPSAPLAQALVMGRTTACCEEQWQAYDMLTGDTHEWSSSPPVKGSSVGVARYEHDMCDTGPIEFVDTWELVVMLRRCQHHLEVTMDQALQGMGMSFARYRALEALASNNAMYISWLARMLRLSRQTARATV